MQCNVCGNLDFIDVKGRKAVRCTQCDSVERSRLLWLYLEKLGLDRQSRVLHLAPEKGIYQKLSGILAPENYDVRDIDPGNYKFAKLIRHIDLCDLDALESGHYDLIVHSHVLEHVACNIAYCLFHLHRALKESGKHIFLVPFLSGKYDECFQDLEVAERVRRFGQVGHMRRFGKEDIDSHLGKLVELDRGFDAEAEFGASLLEKFNIPKLAWKGLTVHSPIILSKYQMKFLTP